MQPSITNTFEYFGHKVYKRKYILSKISWGGSHVYGYYIIILQHENPASLTPRCRPYHERCVSDAITILYSIMLYEELANPLAGGVLGKTRNGLIGYRSARRTREKCSLRRPRFITTNYYTTVIGSRINRVQCTTTCTACGLRTYTAVDVTAPSRRFT